MLTVEEQALPAIQRLGNSLSNMQSFKEYDDYSPPLTMVFNIFDIGGDVMAIWAGFWFLWREFSTLHLPVLAASTLELLVFTLGGRSRTGEWN